VAIAITGVKKVKKRILKSSATASWVHGPGKIVKAISVKTTSRPWNNYCTIRRQVKGMCQVSSED